MKKYISLFTLLLFSLTTYAQRYGGRMSDVYEGMEHESHSIDFWGDVVLILSVISLIIILRCLYLFYEFVRDNHLEIKRLFYSKWLYIPLYCIWITLQISCLILAKDRKPYELWDSELKERIYPSPEECYYPFTHLSYGGTGQNEPLYAYDTLEFILYGFGVPIVLFVIYYLFNKIIKSIWLDGIYIFLTFWLFIAFILPITFFSDGSECGFWIGWFPSIFLTVHFIDKKEMFLKSLKA